MKSRLTYIDQLKGIAIFLVVLGHLLQNDSIAGKENPLFGWIYSFHMPLFMFISGYVAFKTIRMNSFRDFLIFLQKKAVSLLVPYFAWSLLANRYFFTSNTEFNLLDPALSLIRNGGGLWFLWFLFFILLCYSLFYFLSNTFNKKSKISIDMLIFLCLISFLVLLRPLHLLISSDSFLLYLNFFFIGIFISKYSSLSGLLLNKWIFSMCFVLFILLSGRYEFGAPDNFNKAVKIVIAVMAIASLYYITRNISWNPIVDKYAQLWGRSSLVIYATHFAINRITVEMPLLTNLSLISTIVLLSIFSIIVISACLFIQRIVQLCPPLNFILYGQRFKVPANYRPLKKAIFQNEYAKSDELRNASQKLPVTKEIL